MSTALDLINDALTEKAPTGDVEGVHTIKILSFEQNESGNLEMAYTSDVIEKIKPEGFNVIFWAPKEEKEIAKYVRKLVQLFVATNKVTDSAKILKAIFTGDTLDPKKLSKNLLNKQFKGYLFKREGSDGNRYARLFEQMFIAADADESKLIERFDNYAKYMFESQNVLIGKYYKPSDEPTGFGAPANLADADGVILGEDDLGF